MNHALLTIVAPLSPDRLRRAEDAIDRLGNPANPEIAAALGRLDDDAGTHFVSVNAFPSHDPGRAFLALELSGDGSEPEALARLVRAIGAHLEPVFALASDWRAGGDLLAYLTRHRAGMSNGWFGPPGVAFDGTPGLSVGRIRSEAALAARVTQLLAETKAGVSAQARLHAVRKALAAETKWDAALTPASPPAPFAPPSIPLLIAQLAGSFALKYLWPLGVLLLAWTIYGGVRRAGAVHGDWYAADFLGGAVAALWGGFWSVFLLVLLVAGLLVARLRSVEQRDALEERTAEPKILREMFARENRAAQNHMLSVTQRKPGALRWFTSRIVFWVVGELAGRLYKPGFLSEIGTIHFARWVTAPGTRELMFFSNYDGSWESYLEDFIKRAHAGLTGVWSNSIGFPRTENLFQKGATDGERFKRYARHSMVPTRFWYTAYPALTTSRIRTNAEIRRGLSGAMTEDEAIRWLALFGSAPRPAEKLVSSEIQSLVFGGLRFMPFGTCLLYALPGERAAARRWLRALQPHIAFDDGRRLFESPREIQAVVTLALGAGGLARLDLPKAALDSFPFAFRDGMTTESRARILGDAGASAPDRWIWGGTTAPDAALLVYGATPEDVAALEAVLAELAAGTGATLVQRVALREVRKDDKREPFGFVDGISQPVIRGTHKALRNADPIQLVEPGEFILGYPDNSGNMPPGPTLPALADPWNELPLVESEEGFAETEVEAPRDVGRNGSFLVIRHLEQDVAAFAAYCEEQATHLAGRLPPPYQVDAEFIAAKLVGRWRDGSSLVRHPYRPRRHDHEEATHDGDGAHDHNSAGADIATLAGATHPAASEAAPPALPDKPTERPAAAPTEAHPIRRPTRASHGPDNDFLFGTEDPEALRCPFGAHIRRANPRDSMDPGSADQIAISNRHRILRVGRGFEPEEGQNPGLFFMCLNGDIERQFEFVQQTWLRSPSFHGLSCEKDPLLGDGETGSCEFTIPSRNGPVRLSPLRQFITTRGGGYFFIPGKRLVHYLSHAD